MLKMHDFEVSNQGFHVFACIHHLPGFLIRTEDHDLQEKGSERERERERERLLRLVMEPGILREIVKEVVRLHREQHSDSQRPFLNELAWFLAQATCLQHPDLCRHSPENGAAHMELVNRCVKLLSLRDCPAIETIYLQVSTHASIYAQSMCMTKERKKHEQRLEKMFNDIIDIKVSDKRELARVADTLEHLVLQSIIETSGRVNESLHLDWPNEDELCCALQSVFPRTGFLCWMELSEIEKMSQLQELSRIVLGICVYNSAKGKSSINCHLPFDIFEKEYQTMAKNVKDKLKDATDRVVAYRRAISVQIRVLSIEHVLIQRLRDELSFEMQLMSYLQSLDLELSDVQNQMTKLSYTFTKHLKILEATIGLQKCVPNELVFPEFQVTGLVLQRVSDEFRKLRAHCTVAAMLFELSSEANFNRTPLGMASITTDAGSMKLNILAENFGYLPAQLYTVSHGQRELYANLQNGVTHKEDISVIQDVQDSLWRGLKLQLNGYCAINLIKNGGLLLVGDPKAGLVRVGEKFYSFATPGDLNEFVKAPSSFLRTVDMLAMMMPHLVNLLGLQRESCFSSLAIPKILELVNGQPLQYDFSTQTAVHIQPEHQLDEEMLLQRAWQLSNKHTSSTQTIFSHFYRNSSSQVWLPKEKATQSLFGKGTTMSKRVRYFENLQGPPNMKFNIVNITLDV